MPTPTNVPTIDEYLRQRLMPVEGAIPHIPGIEMFGTSIPAGTVGGDLFEYINFQQRYDIDARIERAKRLAVEYLEHLPPGTPIRNSVDDQVEWLKSRPDYQPAMEAEYRFARSSEQLRVAEDLQELHSTAGVLIVDAQGHGIIPAKIASTVHDTFHALMLTELDRYGKTTPRLFENLNLRLAQSVTARNALGMSETDQAREIATMLYGEIHPGGNFRFANFGHPPPLVFSAKCSRLLPVHDDHMAQFLALGLQLPADHPDRRRYFSMNLRQRRITEDDISEITLINPGDILILYTDGIYDGSDASGRAALEAILQKRHSESARNLCDALMEFALLQDEVLRINGDEALIDDKTVLVVKRT
ncbi:MAG: serine/threonine-protein phosphatase [Acidobacteriota bacterium]|nr:serine/threonine-protein phosphatase [Acidobacteriota bacterium]